MDRVRIFYNLREQLRLTLSQMCGFLMVMAMQGEFVQARNWFKAVLKLGLTIDTLVQTYIVWVIIFVTILVTSEG